MTMTAKLDLYNAMTNHLADGEGSQAISALEALRNALYKFSTYLLTYLQISNQR